jgi:hypothetical protein
MRSILFALLFSLPALAVDDHAASPTRGLKICVSSDAPQVVKDAANQVLAAVATQPLLAVMAGGAPPATVTDSAALMKGPVFARAYNHLVVIGLPTDPVIQAAWQREALISDKGIYIFGFGNLQGDIGYIESDRNPFMHGNAIKTTPFETEIVTLTGTTPEGVKQAVAAFLAKGLINGVVAAPGWTRAAPTLLDRDPLSPDFILPSVPAQVGNATCIGVTSANESVYRGALETAGAKPLQIWQFKYYVPGVWDGAGVHRSIPQYLAGLHRMAYDNTLWVAQFSSDAEAASAARQIATNSHWKQKDAEWISVPTPPAMGSKESPVARTIRLWSNGDSVFISTLPDLDSTKIP